MTYLLATPSEWKAAPPAVAAVIFDRIGDFVRSFEPGVVKSVKSPHYMEAAVPERIARELELLIKKIR